MTMIVVFLLQAALGMSFDQLSQTALAQNKSLQAVREQLRQAEARLTQARLRPNPSIDVSQSTDFVFANEGENGFAVAFAQPIELGGKRMNRIRVAEAETELAKAEIADTERQLIALALRSRPDLQAARLREALADAGIALARSQAVPDLTGSVRYAREPNVSRFQPRAFEKESVLGFGISIPLPFFNREQGHIREAASKVTQTRAEREALEHNIRVEVAAAARRYQLAVRSLELIRTGVVGETEQGFSITQLAY